MSLHTYITFGFIIKPEDKSEVECKKTELFKKLIYNIREKFKDSPLLDDDYKNTLNQYNPDEDDLLDLYEFYEVFQSYEIAIPFYFEINSYNDEIYGIVLKTNDTLHNGFDISEHIIYYDNNTAVFDSFKNSLNEFDVIELFEHCHWFTLFEGSY